MALGILAARSASGLLILPFWQRFRKAAHSDLCDEGGAERAVEEITAT
jgi:hypothetical protein